MANECIYQADAKEAQDILLSEANKQEWLVRYQSYADTIISNLESIKANFRRLNQWTPLKFYLNVTNAKKSKKITRFEARYLGQTVAELTSSINGVTISTKPSKERDFEKNNLRDFGCNISLREAAWSGKEAAGFRAFFKNREPVRNNAPDNKGNEEHRIESLLLTAFAQDKQKPLPNIKPITIGGFRFPMPTPISASKHGKTSYAKQFGGGIDIFARTGTGGRATYLCVIEVKDENNPAEPPSHAIQQAIKYSVFIRELLRSSAGADWWKLFGFGGAIPIKLLIHAVCAMPDDKNADVSFAGQNLMIGNDVIQLNYIFFTEDNNEVTDIRTSLSYGKQAKVFT